MSKKDANIFETARTIPVVDVWRRYEGGELKRRGRRYIACCPFHSERSASFTMYEGGGYKCYGCQAAGSDGTSFLARLLGIRPIEAARRIAEDFGLKIHEEWGQDKIRNYQRWGAIADRFEANSQAAVAWLYWILRAIDRLRRTIRTEADLENPIFAALCNLETKVEWLLCGLESDDQEWRFSALVEVKELHVIWQKAA